LCGIAGLIDRRAQTPGEALRATVRAMADTLKHRGPDGGGVWADAEAGVALGHRRLAIIDPSPTGAQPMASADGRYVISYNGEVYNFRDLRRELEAAGRRFRGGSDTEVILEACALWGVDAAVRQLIGMFAFALWDRRERALSLVRDRLGIKPLYYRIDEHTLIFGSELKALRAFPGWRPELDHDALAAYMRYGYVPSPHSIYRGVCKLPPGMILSLAAAREPEMTAYWDMRQAARLGLAAAQSERRDPGEVIAELEASRVPIADLASKLGGDPGIGSVLGGDLRLHVLGAVLRAIHGLRPDVPEAAPKFARSVTEQHHKLLGKYEESDHG